jgi:hypothetical protein
MGGVAVDFTGLQAVGAGADREGCAVGGTVENGSGGAVTVRVRYRAYDASGTVLVALARVPRVATGERREFVSGPFLLPDGSGNGWACPALRRVEMIEAVAEPG